MAPHTTVELVVLRLRFAAASCPQPRVVVRSSAMGSLGAMGGPERNGRT
jgi:hypothetical protein